MPTIADLAGLSRSDLGALVGAADALFTQRNFTAAARAFRGLEALEPRAYFTLRRAQAEAEAGQVSEALETLRRLINADGPTGPSTIEALKLRAKLRTAVDPEGARADLDLVKRLDSLSIGWM